MASQDAISQEVFLNDVKTRIRMYLYRTLESDFDPTIKSIQDLSSIGPINWQLSKNKVRLQLVFTNLAVAVGNYSVSDGDFRMYMLLKMVDIMYDEFQGELFKAFVSSAYGVAPETVVGNLETAYATQPAQNTQFPGLSEHSNPMAPLPQRLVPNVLYQTD
jgi:hypothetical protein